MSASPIPTVCAWCRRVRDPHGEWCEVEPEQATSRIATHGICPDCLERATSHAMLAEVPR
jgi:hypothetical protein